MALPGHTQLARRDYNGLRPTFPVNNTTNNKGPQINQSGAEQNSSSTDEDDTNYRHQLNSQKTKLKRPLVARNGRQQQHQQRGVGHNTSVSQTLQTRMASTAEAAAARARASKRL